ncbi:MAG: metallophosphoesterase [Chitinophagaceae bacterium]
MSRLFGSWIFIILLILLDLYVFQSLKLVSQQVPGKWKWLLYGLYWSFTLAAVVIFLAGPFMHIDQWPKNLRIYFFSVLIGLFIAKFISASFFLMDDLRRVLQWAGGKLFYRYIQDENFKTGTIDRSVFLSWLGFAVGGGVFGSLLWGFGNKYKYKTERLKLRFDTLPAAFKGMKIVHISDIHSGSFTDKKAVEKGIQKILDEKPDLILFTGDLVNDHADEMKDYKDVFERLKAPFGVYSSLGNHDYGDYRQWVSENEKAENLKRLKQIHADMGWRLLMNEHLPIEKNGEQIAILGIENWSAKGNFAKYGKMADAHAGSGKYPFKILLSHDPSHWEAEVREKYKDVDLMLSGHTHGMQFGVEIPGFRWSPVQYMYKQWAGLYEKENQKLYVNRGFGFIGYPGRVGILPEITVIELI